jgi:hypothetical protein
MMTQPHRLVPFNNTTFHVHLTLPTPIYNGKIIDMQRFRDIHQRAILLLQWFEPYFISYYGSPDFLSILFPNEYAGGSMRCAMSRYIGVGTYNPIDMIPGTLQTYAIDDARPTGVRWWRDRLVDETQYVFPSDVIGTDIHYAKHYQCGIELRWLDGFPIEYLQTVLDQLILICAYAQQLDYDHLLKNIACQSQTWNDITFKSITCGYATQITEQEQQDIEYVLQIPPNTLPRSQTLPSLIKSIFDWIIQHVDDKLGIISKMTLQKIPQTFHYPTSFNLIQLLKHQTSWDP